MRFLFYLSFVSLVVLVLWEHSNARGWREIADGAQKAQERATKLAKVAMDRADRCVSDLSKEQAALAEKAPAAKSPADKPAKPGPVRRTGTT